MKILIISQYFWPENFKINDLALGLKEKGHEVTVLTGTPNYPKGTFFDGFSFWKKNDSEWNGVKVYRSKLIPRGNNSLQLMLNYVSFPFFASFRCFFIKEKFDKILVYEPSPITVGLPAIVMGKIKRIPYFFWVQDLWPESLTAAGGVKNKFILNFFDRITKLIYNKSEKVLVQSEGFKNYILNQGISENKIIFYPNSTETFYKPMPQDKQYLSLLPEGFKIIFAGNLGEAQSLNTLIEAARIVSEQEIDVKWVFLGDGRMKGNLEEQIKKNKLENQVFLLGAFPSEQMPNFFACADGLIVSLKKDKIFSLTIPSKVQSYMACEKPILASLDGEGARIVEISNSGFTSSAENALDLAKNVVELYNLSEEERNTLGKNAGDYFRKEFERELLLNRLISILNNE
ncbi:MAG: glycosyltransferase family 4 protein [Limnohabitans sp.]|nr:glycosyltransferase family 4 protein [Limnohabitans sp.]